MSLSHILGAVLGFCIKTELFKFLKLCFFKKVHDALYLLQTISNISTQKTKIYIYTILFAQKQTNTRDKPNFKMKPRIVLQTFSEKCFSKLI